MTGCVLIIPLRSCSGLIIRQPTVTLLMGRPGARRSLISRLTEKQKTRGEKGEKEVSCHMHYSQKVASSDFSKAQIVVNDSKLPRGFEISTV